MATHRPIKAVEGSKKIVGNDEIIKMSIVTKRPPFLNISSCLEKSPFPSGQIAAPATLAPRLNIIHFPFDVVDVIIIALDKGGL